MTEDGFDNETASDGGQAITRREALRKGAVVGGTALWVAPMVQNIGIARAFANSASPICCTSESYDVFVKLVGTIDGDAGPIRAFPTNGNDCFSNLAVQTPGQPTAKPFVTADTACVGGSSTGRGCTAFATLEKVAVDLRNINTNPNSPGPFDVQLTAVALNAKAECICGGGGCTRSGCTGEVVLTIAGNSQKVPCLPNEKRTFEVPGILKGTLIVNEQGDGCSINTVHLTVEALNLNPMFAQSIDIILGHASASC